PLAFYRVVRENRPRKRRHSDQNRDRKVKYLFHGTPQAEEGHGCAPPPTQLAKVTQGNAVYMPGTGRDGETESAGNKKTWTGSGSLSELFPVQIRSRRPGITHCKTDRIRGARHAPPAPAGE